MQANQKEDSILFFQDEPEQDPTIGSEGQKSDIQLVVNSPSNADQGLDYGLSPDINNNLANAPVTRVIYRCIPMSGSQELMMLTSSLEDDQKQNDAPSTVKEQKTGFPEKRDDLYKSQEEDKPAQGDEKTSSKKKRSLSHQDKMRIILNPLLLIFALINLGLLIALVISQKGKTDSNFRPVTSALSYIGSNLQSHPILDIKLEDNGSCPQDYEIFVLGVWPGTVHGCDCDGALSTGLCERSRRDPNPTCDDYTPRNPIKMYDWGGSKWCVLRAKPENQYVKKADCPNDFKKCSSGICVLNTLDCPVTKVELKGGSVVVEKALGESPVIGFTITPNDIPCFSDAYFARGSVSPYKLINEDEYGCGKYGLDKQYSIQLDSQKQSELFNENDFPEKVLSLPSYSRVYENTDSVLSYRKRLSVAETDFCMNLDTEILEKSSEAFDKLKSHVPLISIVALVCQGFLVGFVVLAILRVLCEGESFGSAFFGKISGFWLFFYEIFAFIEEIVLIILLVHITRGRANMRETEDYLSEIAEMGCFLDQQAQSVVNDFSDLIEIETGTPLKYCLPVMCLASFSLICSVYMSWKNRDGLGMVKSTPSSSYPQY